MVTKGREIVNQGKTLDPDGRPSRIQSKLFRCSDCHNTRREDPDLSRWDPAARLAYAEELCASACYQGRALETWEMEAVLFYP